MSLKLSDADWGELWQEETTAIAQSDFFEQVCKFSGQFGRGSDRYIPLRNGLYLIICDYQLWEDVTLDGYNCYTTYPSSLCVSFVVSGTVKTIHHALTDYVFEVPGKNHIEFVPEGRETEDWSAGDRIIKIRVGITTEVLREMNHDSVATLPKEFRLLVKEQESPPFYRLETTTSEMHIALQQILNCPYQGWTRQFYLESKALELLILWLTQAIDLDKTPKS